jgi:hypothetical protein
LQRAVILFSETHVAADLNGDGKPDLAGSGATSAAVMLNNGDGAFQARVDYLVAGQTQDVAAGDFNPIIVAGVGLMCGSVFSFLLPRYL